MLNFFEKIFATINTPPFIFCALILILLFLGRKMLRKRAQTFKNLGIIPYLLIFLLIIVLGGSVMLWHLFGWYILWALLLILAVVLIWMFFPRDLFSFSWKMDFGIKSWSALWCNTLLVLAIIASIVIVWRVCLWGYDVYNGKEKVPTPSLPPKTTEMKASETSSDPYPKYTTVYAGTTRHFKAKDTCKYQGIMYGHIIKPPRHVNVVQERIGDGSYAIIVTDTDCDIELANTPFN